VDRGGDSFDGRGWGSSRLWCGLWRFRAANLVASQAAVVISTCVVFWEGRHLTRIMALQAVLPAIKGVWHQRSGLNSRNLVAHGAALVGPAFVIRWESLYLTRTVACQTVFLAFGWMGYWWDLQQWEAIGRCHDQEQRNEHREC
jgi:hypothetical protein